VLRQHRRNNHVERRPQAPRDHTRRKDQGSQRIHPRRRDQAVRERRTDSQGRAGRQQRRTKTDQVVRAERKRHTKRSDQATQGNGEGRRRAIRSERHPWPAQRRSPQR
jgi:hypothetical protein